MFRTGLQRLAVPLTRSYSQGFDISQFLTRIEAATKTPLPKFKPKNATKRPSAPKQNNVAAKSADGTAAGPKTPRSARNTNAARTRPAAGATANAGANAGAGAKASARPSAKKSESAARNATAESADATASTASVEATGEWSTLDSTAPTPLPRGNRRPRKAGSKAKPAQRKQQVRAKPAKKVGSKAPVDSRQYTPYLTPKQALDIVLRNEGTSSGGFIAPFDVSLQSLQPNFVASAVSYNTRVRSLLNAVPENAASDRSQLSRLVGNYVSGDYTSHTIGDAPNTLSGQGLVSTINANHSLDLHTRQFLVDVGAGKVPPKQIPTHAHR